MKPSDMSGLAALMSSGQHAELESKARELLDRQPDSGIAWQLLALALTRQDKDPLHAHERAAALLPKDPGAHNNLGNALARRGRLDDAVTSYRRALLLNPELAEAHNNLGHSLLDLGRPAEAAESCRRALDIKPGYAEAHDNLGTAFARLARLDEAPACHRRAIEIEPRFAEAHNNLGNNLLELGQIDGALASYRRALGINPGFAEAHNNLGNALRSLGKLQEAVSSYRRALALNAAFAEAYCNLGIALRLEGRTAEAQAHCRTALDINPASTAACVALAESSADLGEFTAAADLLERAVAIEPESPEAWAARVRLRKTTRADADWLAAALRIVARPLAPQREICLRYAIGKYFDDVGDFDPAFANFRRANELTAQRRAKHDREHLTHAVDRITRAYDKDFLARANIDAVQSPRPVFIVGMLRSGTTLAEQILASHRAVFGAGELTFWSSAAAMHGPAATAGATDGTRLRELAAAYLGQLHELSSDALRVVDKMPTNFPFLGLIHAALPNARIIHMQRNPLDTCLSIYTQHFETFVSYANDLEDLAHYYTEYLRVMQHWRTTLPGNAILDVPYEELVEQPEAWSRKMLEFIGLPWDPQCLDPHLANRAVITASKWQVRQKINTASVGRWRNYAKFLGPLLRLLPAAG